MMTRHKEKETSKTQGRKKIQARDRGTDTENHGELEGDHLCAPQTVDAEDDDRRI